MLRRVEIEGNFLHVDEAADGSVQIVDHPELTARGLSNHVIEVFRAGKSLGCFQDEDAIRIPGLRRSKDRRVIRSRPF
jgi:hypothetical protein